MLDQCHNIEPKIPAMIRSVMTLQETFARALLVDTDGLREAQASGDVLESNRLLQDAYQVDVRPMLAELRLQAGLPADPYRAYLESGEGESRAASRAGGVAAGWS
jgi:L-rhamnose isomerase/sugar isomerase